MNPAPNNPPAARLTDSSLQTAIAHLVKIDPDLAKIIADYGPPPLWAREPGFPTLIQIILEQQVSLASAKAAFTRLVDRAGQLTPQRFLEFSDPELKAIGFSRQKTRYGRALSQAILQGILNLDNLAAMSDEAARGALIRIKGIGPWTAEIYLLMALLRPNIWPTGDLALVKAIQEVKRLPVKPTAAAFIELGNPWQPWRAVAARILWHYYLSS